MFIVISISINSINLKPHMIPYKAYPVVGKMDEPTSIIGILKSIPKRRTGTRDNALVFWGD